MNYLTLPILTALLTFGFAVVSDPQSVYLDRIEVPSVLAQYTGFTNQVILARLRDEMQEIERQATSRAEARKLQLQSERTAVGVLGDYLSVTPLVRVVQTSIGLIDYSVTGEMVSIDNRLTLVLRAVGAGGSNFRVSQTTPSDQIETLIRATARATMRQVDPYILAAYQFRHDFRTRNFAATREIIDEVLRNGMPRLRPWMYNLWGIIDFVEGDEEDAVAKFQQALAEQPDFTLPQLNWGIILARGGRHQDAITRFRTALEHGTGDRSPSTLAALHSELGFSLALQGDIEAAFTAFETAVKIDPKYAEVYSNWAEVLTATGRGDQAEVMSRKALALAPAEVVYAENLLGIIHSLTASVEGRVPAGPR